jgi:hypothetical protein
VKFKWQNSFLIDESLSKQVLFHHKYISFFQLKHPRQNIILLSIFMVSRERKITYKESGNKIQIAHNQSIAILSVNPMKL